jgi:asparagine synthase (glutamine-hydrolysing)
VPVRTFSIGFGDPAYDELAHARTVAEAFGTRHTEFCVEPDAVEVLPLLATRYGEPFADPSAIPSYYLARTTAEHVKVALTGDGADEAFGGYPRHLAARLCGEIDRFPGVGPLAGLLGRIAPAGRDRKSVARRAKLLLGAMGSSPAERHATWLAYSAEGTVRSLYAESFREATDTRDLLGASRAFEDAYARCAGRCDAATAAMYADLVGYLPNDPLVKMDIETMACGLEARAPLLDHRVAELAFRIPSRHKLHGRRGKHLLRHAFRDLLPASILTRGKMGFGVPIARWLREDLAAFARSTLLRTDTILFDVFDRVAVTRALDAHVAGRSDHAYLLWSLLCFELWAREFAPRTA